MEQKEIQEFIEVLGFKKLNEVQETCIAKGVLNPLKYDKDFQNFLIIGPTSSGKTLMGELASNMALKHGKNVIVLEPTRTLANQMKNEFQKSKLSKLYRIVTPSDKDAYKTGNILITTYDGFYKTILMNPVFLKRFGFFFIDEIHTLYSDFHGFIVEKILVLLRKEKKQIFGTSATLEPRDKIGEWLGVPPENNIYFSEEKRPIPLTKEVLNLYPNTEEECDGSNKKKREKNMEILYKYLSNGGVKPYLIFLSTVAETKSHAEELLRFLIKYNVPIEKNNREELEKRFQERVGRKLTEDEEILLKLLEYRIGFHNSRLISEELQNEVVKLSVESKIDWLFATSSLSQGVNTPTMTVVWDGLSWWKDGKRVPYPKWFTEQGNGRSGRGFKDKVELKRLLDKGIKAKAVYAGSEQEIAPYLEEGGLEFFESRINVDTYLKKFLLEIILLNENNQTSDEAAIIDYFENTYYYSTIKNYQPRLIKVPKFQTDLFLAPHMQYLIDNEYITSTYGDKIKITTFGQIVMDFLIQSNHQVDLEKISCLRGYVKEMIRRKEKFDFNFVYKLLKIFPEITLYKVDRVRNPIIDEFFHGIYNLNIENIKHVEYTAYSFFYGWMEEKTIDELYKEFLIFSSPIRTAIKQIIELFDIFQKIYLLESPTKQIDYSFNELRKRLSYGLKKESMDLLTEKVGRERIIKLKNYILNSEEYKSYNDEITTLTIKQYLETIKAGQGEEKVIEILEKVEGIGPVRAEKILIKLFPDSAQKIEKKEEKETEENDNENGEEKEIVFTTKEELIIAQTEQNKVDNAGASGFAGSESE